MAIFDRINSTFRRIAASDKGTTAITFSLSIIPLLLAAGAAIDYVRYSEAETTLQAALDSGALAVGASSSLTHDDRIKAGEDTFIATFRWPVLISISLMPASISSEILFMPKPATVCRPASCRSLASIG